MAEKIITILFLLGSIMYLYLTQDLTFGTLDSPKSGFLPVLAAILGILVALVLIIKKWHSKEITDQHHVNWTKFIFIIIGLLFYITIFNIIGYFVATFIFLFYFFKIADTTGWLLPAMLAAASASIFVLIFKYYLAVTLP